jgi:isocitrate dehydrogenase
LLRINTGPVASHNNIIRQFFRHFFNRNNRKEMNETEANLSKRQKKARNNKTAEDLIAMSNVTSPQSMRSQVNARSGDFQIAMLKNLEGDSIDLINLLNVVAMHQVLSKHGKAIVEEINQTVKVLAGEFQDPSHPILPSPSSSTNFPPSLC